MQILRPAVALVLAAGVGAQAQPPTADAPVTNGPRTDHALGAYDARLRRVILIGGAGNPVSDQRDQVWSWDGLGWTAGTRECGGCVRFCPRKSRRHGRLEKDVIERRELGSGGRQLGGRSIRLATTRRHRAARSSVDGRERTRELADVRWDPRGSLRSMAERYLGTARRCVAACSNRWSGGPRQSRNGLRRQTQGGRPLWWRECSIGI